MTINTRENKKRLRDFAIKIIEDVRKDPPIKMTAELIAKSKYPGFMCQTCGQFGCDRIEGGQYIHNDCFMIIREKTLEFMAKELHLSVKKQ